MSEQVSDPQTEFASRYERIDDASDRSWYMHEARPFEVYMSAGTIKPSTRLFGEFAARETLAGNMSPLYGEGSDDDKLSVAVTNM